MRFSGSAAAAKWLSRVSLLLVAVFAAVTAHSIVAAAGDAPADPWTAAQTVQPAALAKELAGSKSADRPTIVCVAPHALYLGGHISGALYHGAGSTPEGIDDLEKWAQPVPRATRIVIYCGCCPMERCPNLRPAFVALRDMGFTHVRALLIPTNFYTDWVKPGYPYEPSPAQ
jgi:thiosulfate/3-mercaptopyruvate sulfurtransferase